MNASSCPCGGASYATCCEPYHRGAEPEDAVRLMRSRFSAFAKQDVAYLWRTLHPDHEDRASSFASYADFEKSMRAHFAQKPIYQRLQVLDSTPPDAEGVATVHFRASIRIRGRDASFSERSLFAHDGTGFRYVAGAVDR